MEHESDWRLGALKKEYKAHLELSSKLYELSENLPFPPPASEEDLKEESLKHRRIAEQRLRVAERLQT